MGMNLGDLNKVWEIRALKKKDRQEEATKILERVAKQVQPIMRKHNWRVKLLSEFCPNNSRLLGLNVGGGVHVKLRLRRPNRDLDFFPFDQILDTMLHELCHNAHGPHNANFYKLWDEIRKECEELMAKGITGTGEGFDLSGRRLGGFSHQPPLSSLRKTTLVAAEKRARLGSLLPSGPKRLGGDNSIMAALSPVQAAAMAAERRLQDDIWCGSQSCEASGDGESSSNLSEDSVGLGQSAESSKQQNGSAVPTLDPFSRKRSRESDKSLLFQSSKGHSESSFVDSSIGSSTSRSMLDHDISSQKRSRGPDSNSFSESFNCHRVSKLVGLSSAPSSESMLGHDAIKNPEEVITWECVTCTLLNPPLAPICKLCGTEKPKDGCTKFKIWSCKFCTLENNVELERCLACGQWRYSHGPPVSTSAPYLGT